MRTNLVIMAAVAALLSSCGRNDIAKMEEGWDPTAHPFVDVATPRGEFRFGCYGPLLIGWPSQTWSANVVLAGGPGEPCEDGVLTADELGL